MLLSLSSMHEAWVGFPVLHRPCAWEADTEDEKVEAVLGYTVSPRPA